MYFDVLANGLVFLSYMMIPLALVYTFRKKKRQFPYIYVTLMFAAFIFLCGFTHLSEVLVFWWPNYKLFAVITMMTGIVSFVTAVSIWKIVPKILDFRPAEELYRERMRREATEKHLREKDVQLRRMERRLEQLHQLALDISPEKAHRIKEQEKNGTES